jgi:hypothetical protein
VIRHQLHSLRRWWWKFTGRRALPSQCHDCGKGLTADERWAYETNCELCERALWEGWDDL